MEKEGSDFPSLPSLLPLLFHPYPVLGIILVAIALVLFFFFVTGWIWGAGYEPTNRRVRDLLIGMIEERFQTDDRFVFYDLGSGFGGVLIDVAERFPNAFCTGIEADWFKCAVGSRRVRNRGLEGRVMTINGDLLAHYFSDADVVYMFLSPLILKRKEFRERIRMLKPGCLIISYSHKIPGLEPAAVIGKHLFIYARTAS
ncbi:MAG: hypothetical protein JRN20_21360 [Nitrososphaerota archaeon]|nr:hypothetical protein [Nitrososphaerota archaeon]